MKDKEYWPIGEFLKNPLLTTLLYRCYEYKQNLPLKKPVFYRQVFDALYDWHDATKNGYNTREKKSKLDIDSFAKVLRVIGYISVMKGEIEGDTDVLLSWIREAKKLSGLSFSESEFLDDIFKAVPVFIKEGISYRWSHKSLAEYFAAQYICTEGKEHQEKILGGILKCGHIDRFSNMLDQIYDLDIAGFRKSIMVPFASAFISHWSDSYKNMDARIPNEIIKIRKSLTFGCVFFLAKNISLEKNNFEKYVYEKFLPISDYLWNQARKADSVLMRVGAAPDKTIAFEIQGPWSVIYDILSDKKDPLLISKNKLNLERYKRPITQVSRKGLVRVTDQPESLLNSRLNFGSVTKALCIREMVIDADRLLSFKYTMDEVSNNLTDLLLEDLLGGTERGICTS